jgi:hypothetical protein
MGPPFAAAAGVSSTRLAPSSATPTHRSGVIPCTWADAGPTAATASNAAVTSAMPIRRMDLETGAGLVFGEYGPRFATNTDEFVGYAFEGVPVWQMLVHVVNHGTKHRAEAAALLT